MCKPIYGRGGDCKEGRAAIHDAISELVHAMSALNMPPDFIPAEERPAGAEYLSQIDRWVKHSTEHLEAALSILMAAVNTPAGMYVPWTLKEK